MNNDINIQDKIDKFLTGELTGNELKEFEQLLANDPELKESVELQRMIVDEINERESFMAILEKAEEEGVPVLNSGQVVNKDPVINEPRGKSITINFRKAFAYAAVLIVAVLLVWQPFKSSDSAIFNKYGYAISISDLSVAAGEPNTRGNMFYFDNFNPADNERISEALNFYSEGKYKEATDIFEKLLVSPERNNELTLYMAVSQLYSGETAKAVENLKYLNSLETFELKDNAEFYLALAYLKNGDTLRAKKILKEIKNKGNDFSEKAAQMLREMRWF